MSHVRAPCAEKQIVTKRYLSIVQQGEAPKTPPKDSAVQGPVSGLGEPPAYLMDDPKCVAVWNELVAVYGSVLGESERMLFAKLVVAEMLYREAQKEVARVGTLIKSPTGYPIQNPYLAVVNKQREAIIRTSQELGITPLARGRVKASKAASKPASSPFKNLRTLDD